MSAATTQKYFTSAACDGVEPDPSNGSFAGTSATGGSCLREAYHEAMKPMPPSRMMMLTPVQTMASPVGRLPTPVSEGGGAGGCGGGSGEKGDGVSDPAAGGIFTPEGTEHAEAIRWSESPRPPRTPRWRTSVCRATW